jgi:protein FRA10AC1
LGIHFDYPHDEDKRDGKRKRKKRDMMPGLRSFELPFAYVEGGERKEALVKVRLCPRCEGKLLWKPGQVEEDADELEESMENQRRERSSRDERSGDKAPSKRRSRSRSRSPRRRGREE